ncbi:hypothetical protein PQQ53_21395 [Paraburkholderia strydomiana]|uniref:hypothetical protein n=1 Tax=Paraburkholderia strydomiana TaxID=1245417 RepID=UPI0038B88A0A
MTDEWVTRWAYAQALKRSPFNATQRHILRIISDFQNEKYKRLGFAGRETIAADAGCVEKTVDRCAAEAKEAGWLDYWPKNPNNPKSTTEYRLMIPKGVKVPDKTDDDEADSEMGERDFVTLSKGHCVQEIGTLSPEIGSQSPSNIARRVESNVVGIAEVTTHSFAIAHESSTVGKSDAPTMIDGSDLGINVRCLDYCRTHGVSEPRDRWEEFCNMVLFQREELLAEPYSVATSTAFSSWLKGRREWARRSRPWVYVQAQTQTTVA